MNSQLEAAADVLRRGGVVALPSDTLYALAAVARDEAAVHRVYAIKGREEGKPLPLFVSSLDMARRVARIDDRAARLAQAFWPGGLTLVLPRQPDFVSPALAGGDSVALRMPDEERLLSLIATVDEPLTATSANRSGGPDPVDAAEVRRQLDGEYDMLIDGGACPVGISSTVVDCTADPPRILRHGAVPEAQVMRLLST